MKKLVARFALAVAVVAVAAALQACAASYSQRMKHLDYVAAKGVAYRGQLHKQGTQPSEESCTTGWNLLQDAPPLDGDFGGVSPKWKGQVAEAFVKSCMTGQPRPKPDPSGVGAVTAVPFSSPSAAPSSP